MEIIKGCGVVDEVVLFLIRGFGFELWEWINFW